MNSRTGVLFSIIIGLLFTALISRNGDVAWMCIFFITYFGVAIIQSPVIEEINLHAHRSVTLVERNTYSVFDVEVKVRNEGIKKINLVLVDPLLKGMKIINGNLSRRVSLCPGEETGLKYSFEAFCGNFSWHYIHTIASDPFGIIEIESDIVAEANITVHPQLFKFRTVSLYPWKTLSSPGCVPTRMGGSGTDFFGIRDYHPGDPLKALDWRLTARHPHKFFTREFVQEKTADINLILDARQKMDLTVNGESIFEHEVKATASLAEMCIRQGHRVGLLIFGKSIIRQLPDYGKIQLNRILNRLAAVTTQSDGNSSSIHRILAQDFPRSTLMVIISPVDTADKELYHKLRAFGYQVILISPDTLDFARPMLAQDNMSLLALKASQLERRIILNYITQFSVSVINWKVSQPLLPLVRNILGRPMRVRKI